MPVYDYDCPACGGFTVLRPMAEYREPHDCPACGAAAPRVVATAPYLAGMDGARRTAFTTNERAAHAPHQASHRHGPGCGCGASRTAPGAADASPARSFPAARPWMISH
jgi:putative FmdB family regulatory protein